MNGYFVSQLSEHILHHHPFTSVGLVLSAPIHVSVIRKDDKRRDVVVSSLFTSSSEQIEKGNAFPSLKLNYFIGNRSLLSC